MNRHKYAVSVMRRTLNISRSTYYYEAKERLSEAALEMAVINEFYSSRQNYGTRKLKAVLKPLGFLVSRKRISRMMKKFNQELPLKFVITDLTYVRVVPSGIIFV